MALQNNFVAIATAASGATSLVTGVAGKRIVVTRYAVSGQGAVAFKFQSGSTDVTGPLRLAADGNAVIDEVGNILADGLFACAVGQDLSINLSAAVQVGGYLSYRFEG